MVMRQGRVSTIVDASEATQELLMHHSVQDSSKQEALHE